MNEFRRLLDRFWVTRLDDKELYYDLKRRLSDYESIVNEQLGWNLISNEMVIKLEKTPPRSMPWMGVQEFSETLDYCLLCALLLYLSDLEDGQQFLLSSLTEAVKAYLEKVQPIDWTRFPHRKSLVRVLRYAQQIQLIIAYDGSSDGFGSSQEQEVLYENTGLSRYYAVHFGRDISACQSAQDFESFSWEGDSDRGRQRVHRVYRQLALCPALYWSSQDHADYDYVKNQRQWVSHYLEDTLGGELQIHKNGAFFVVDSEDRFGLCHPRNTILSDVVLLLCSQIREKVRAGSLLPMADDRIVFTRTEFNQELDECRCTFSKGWGSQIRDMSDEALQQAVIDYMLGWMLLESQEDAVVLLPAAGEWVGHYSKRYLGIEEGIQDGEPLDHE
ncbi:MAG: TIGR02678 family protein [Eubacteriales bacterium]|nr:TIGR02678 family protein [Eubacteriales bacterium]